MREAKDEQDGDNIGKRQISLGSRFFVEVRTAVLKMLVQSHTLSIVPVYCL